MNIFKAVLEFWKLGHPDKIQNKPGFPEQNITDLCLRLIREEHQELNDAVAAGDLVEVADALGDILYVTVGMGIAYGLPMEEVFEEVQRTNMAKFPNGVVTRRPSDGKIMKPEGWTKPDIAGIIQRAIEGTRD